MQDEEYILNLISLDIRGLLSENEKEELQVILKMNPGAKKLYNQMNDVLNDTEIRKSLDQASTQMEFSQIEQRIRQKKRTSKITRLVAVAAILIFCFGIGYLNFFSNKPDVPISHIVQPMDVEMVLPNGQHINLSRITGDQIVQVGSFTVSASNKSLRLFPQTVSSIGNVTLKVPVGKDYQIVLPDNTEVWLNATTEISFPLSFEGNTREINIHGEAYLKVSKMVSKPFIVHLPMGQVQVLGTEFNVNTYEVDLIQVALVEGRVKMKAGTDSIILEPGKLASYSSSTGLHAADFYADDLLSWREGMYKFDEVPLEQVFQILPRWYGIKVVMDNNIIGKTTFTGSIDRTRPITESLEGLKEMKILDYYFDKDSILHIR